MYPFAQGPFPGNAQTLGDGTLHQLSQTTHYWWCWLAIGVSIAYILLLNVLIVIFLTILPRKLLHPFSCLLYWSLSSSSVDLWEPSKPLSPCGCLLSIFATIILEATPLNQDAVCDGLAMYAAQLVVLRQHCALCPHTPLSLLLW